MAINSELIKKEFPILQKEINGKRLVYLDNASTSQKPKSVIDALTNYYESMNANVHKGVHTLAEIATEHYERTRLNIAKFINADSAEEIIFTRNGTEACNLVAYTYGETALQEGDNIVVTDLEHHSNYIPWQQLCLRKKAQIRSIPILNGEGLLDMNSIDKLIDKRTKIVAITQMSNVLGTIPNLKKIIAAAKVVGAKIMIDAVQGISHLGFDVKEIDCDFAMFSGHKMFGPTGIGFLYTRRELLEDMPPFLFGGGMVKEVYPASCRWGDLPSKFEAGTPDIGGVIALDKAIEFLKQFSFEEIIRYDQELLQYARERFGSIKEVKLYGPSNVQISGGILSFTVEGVHPHDIASIFNEHGVAIRAGHHCAMPLIQALGTTATARMSFHIYNNKDDIDIAFEALKNTLKIFKI